MASIEINKKHRLSHLLPLTLNEIVSDEDERIGREEPLIKLAYKFQTSWKNTQLDKQILITT